MIVYITVIMVNIAPTVIDGNNCTKNKMNVLNSGVNNTKKIFN